MSENYDTLSDRALDDLVAEKIMAWDLRQQVTGPLTCNKPIKWWISEDGAATAPGDFTPSTDDNAARLVRDRIAELGLRSSFTNWLVDVTGDDFDPAVMDFRLLQATPRQQCVAALRALGGTDGR